MSKELAGVRADNKYSYSKLEPIAAYVRQQLTGLLADGTWVPMAAVHFAAVTAALLAGWMAVRAKG